MNIPKFHTVRVTGPYAEFTVFASDGERIGTFPTEKMAARVAKAFDKQAVRDFTKAQRKQERAA